MKLTDIIKDANANLFRNKMRSILTILAIFIGSFAIISVNAIHTGVNDFIDQQVESIGGDNYIEIAPAAIYDQLSSLTLGGKAEVKEYNPNQGTLRSAEITEKDLEAIRAIDGVNSAEPYHYASAEYITSPDTTKKYNVTIRALSDNSLHADMLTGRQPDADSTSPEIMLTPEYVEPLGFTSNQDAIGKTITLGIKQTAKCYLTPDNCTATITATITGVQASGILTTGNMLNINPSLNNAIYDLSMEDAPAESKQKISLVTGNIDPKKAATIKEKLKDLHLTGITIDDEVGMIRTFFDVILIVFTIFGGIALLAAAIGIINTLLMSVQERTREIGLDKALGLSQFKIFLSFSIEAILLGFWGSALGTAVSMALGYLINSLAHNPGGFLETLPTFTLVEFTPLSVASIILIVMFIAFLAGTLPAYKASKKNPIDALRYE
ncbi:ABC transporter permease [Candidatus Saccharibacteria bacterium]|nr:ABC transporter permease [Candidatus Saccharibacteria bacterium]